MKFAIAFYFFNSIDQKNKWATEYTDYADLVDVI